MINVKQNRNFEFFMVYKIENSKQNVYLLCNSKYFMEKEKYI